MVKQKNWVSVALVASLAFNGLCALRLYQLRPVDNLLKEGTTVPELQGTSTAGTQESIAFNVNRPTVLYVFSPSCGWCSRNLPNIKHLTASVASKYRVIGVSTSTDGLAAYVAANGFSFPVIHTVPKEISARYRFGGTPQTIVVSDRGKVLRVWMGAYTEQTQKEIEGYFRLRLPGLLDPVPAKTVLNVSEPGVRP